MNVREHIDGTLLILKTKKILNPFKSNNFFDLFSAYFGFIGTLTQQRNKNQHSNGNSNELNAKYRQEKKAHIVEISASMHMKCLCFFIVLFYYK